ncbi:MAG: hemagglutinin repeat-containing protein [Paludibacterium sp.]|uniref:hemagglutinin repeat-containing protein n=1 Tax=Paludibacterium sp. TaxID=1917523 RepID=UPI0025EA2180|nr:hemagglutinin repeat-containing protein [Paludibacterium sp.]MBV8046265.1 hemagglutinin repeat-containing protein [Paludibacterium sp.]
MKVRFPLSCRGRVAAVLTLSLIYSPRLWAGGIVPAPGSNVEVRQAASGADVVQIVGANAQGLSHNRYNAHDVSAAGAVYNNGVAAGASLLAGQMQSNQKLGGRAATVILNEVVSRNPSLLLGRMEVFGQAADLVLANPNGITCNGCGFVNTRRAALLVGTPQWQDGQLHGLASAGTQSLTIGPGGATANQALDLIAPRIDAQGALVATSGIHAVAGQAQMAYDTREVTSSRASPAERLDSAFLGGMQAGRISIVSTDDGAGVNLAGAIESAGRIKVDAQGPLNLADVRIKGERVGLAAKSIEAKPLVRLEEKEQRQHDESWFIWKTGETKVTERERKTHFGQARIEGESVSLRATDALSLNAAEVHGGDIRLQAGEIALSGSETLDGHSTERAAWLNSWQRNQYTETSHYGQRGVVLDAKGDLVLNAQGSIKAQGAALSAAKDMRVTAGRDIVLSGLEEKTVVIDRGDRYLEGPSLSSGQWNHRSEKQTLKQSALQSGGNLLLRAAGAVALNAAKVQTGADAVLKSAGRIDIGTQVVNQSLADAAHSTHWGGIGGSNRADDRNSAALNVPSAVRAKGALRVEGGLGIHLVGSTVRGEGGARAVAGQGNVQIDHATDLTQSLIDERHGGAFDIQTGRHYGKELTPVTQGAQLTSDTNLTVASAADVAVTGSHVEAGGALTVQAGGDVRVSAAAAERQQQRQDAQMAWQASAGPDARYPGAYRAGVGITQTETRQTQTGISQTGAVLAGGSVRVEAKGDIGVHGGEVAARQGDATLNGRNLTLDAAYDTQRDEQAQGRAGSGIFVAASWEQLRAGLSQDFSSTRSTTEARTPRVSQVSASGDLNVQAPAGTLKTEGARLNAGGQLTVAAGAIDNRAAMGSNSSTSQSGGGSGDLAGVVAFGGLLKPVQAVVDKAANGQLADAARDAKKIKDKVQDGAEKVKQGGWAAVRDIVSKLSTPSAGGVIDIVGQRQRASESSQTASGSRFEGAGVSVKSAGAVQDQATRYQASHGAVDLTASEHRFDTVETRAEQRADGGNGGGLIQATTLTGKDLRLKASGSGGENWRQQSDTQAAGGEIRATDGVRIAVEHDANYRGATIDAGQGRIAVTVGGALQVQAAEGTRVASSGRNSGSLDISVRSVPNADVATSKTPGVIDAGGGQGKAVFDVARQQEESLMPMPARLSAQAGVSLHAGGDMALAGAQIGAAEGGERAAEVTLNAGGKIDLAAARRKYRQEGWDLGGSGNGEVYTGARPSGGQVEVRGHERAESRDGWLPSTVDARRVALESAGDLRLTGARVSGEQVAAQVGNDLRVTSLKDDNRSRQGTLEATVASPNLGQILSGAETARLKTQFESDALDAVTQQSGLYGSQKLEARVGGQTVLEGGQLQSGQGPVATGGPIVAHTVPGQADSVRYGAAFNGTLSSLANGVVRDVLGGKAPLGWSQERHHQDRPSQPSQ